MPFRDRNKEQKKSIEEKVIEISVPMHGMVSFGEPVNLKINGKFSGSLTTRGTLTLGNGAQVDADITGDNIVIAGKIKGNVLARKMLVLMPTAVLTGDVTTPKLNVVEGAIFQGKCHMMDEYLTVDELAQYLEIDEPALVELAASGKIPAVKDADGWKFERVKIDSWAAAGKIQ